MRPRWFLPLASTAALGFLLWKWPRTSAPGPSRAARGAEILLTSPDPLREDVEAKLAASDRVVAALRAQGVTDVAQEIRNRLASTPLSDAEVLAFCAANPARLGNSPSLERRILAETLLRVHLVRTSLGVPDPQNGLHYP